LDYFKLSRYATNSLICAGVSWFNRHIVARFDPLRIIQPLCQATLFEQIRIIGITGGRIGIIRQHATSDQVPTPKVRQIGPDQTLGSAGIARPLRIIIPILVLRALIRLQIHPNDPMTSGALGSEDLGALSAKPPVGVAAACC